VKGYGPADPLQTPRFAGISTFLRLPHTLHLEGVDVAFVGLPFDTSVSFRAGARFGPKAIREGSLSLRPAYNMAQRVAVFDRVSAIDYGDAGVVPGFIERSYERMAASLHPICEAGIVPIGFGGDHSVLLGELRAVAAVHGPVALLQFDAHSDTWDEYFGEKYTHGTVVRRAVEEGLIDAKRSTLMGMRGGLYAPGDLEEARDMGFTVLPWDDLAQLGTSAVAAAVERATGKVFLTFDIDFVDPAFAPGTGTPECGGPSSMQALSLLRACRGVDLAGADVVEVLPDLDHSHLTGTLAATVAWEILSLIAAERPDCAPRRREEEPVELGADGPTS
jgi:agmatinase